VPQRSSIKTNLILVSVGITTALMLSLFLGAALWFNNNQRKQMDVFLHTEGIGIASLLSSFLSHEKTGVIRENGLLVDPNFTRLMDAYMEQRNHKPLTYPTTLVIADSMGHFISSTDEAMHINPGFLATKFTGSYDRRKIGNDANLFSVQYENMDYRVLETPIELDGRLVGTVRLACQLEPATKSSLHFELLTGLLFLASVLISGIGAIFLMTRILKPVRKMSATMTHISEGKLNTRLEQLGGNDEFSTLAITFNDALDRIEKAARFQDELVSDLSHQLRTPLTSMRGMVEVAMLKDHSKEEYQEILESNLAEIDRITSLVNTMLSLAKLDGHAERLNYSKCDLIGLFDETLRELEPLWDAKAIHFLYRIFKNDGMVEYRAEATSAPLVPARISDLFPVDLDLFRFKQAVINILDNAYKYSPYGGQIGIELYPEIVGEPGYCGFVIMNNGPAIAEATLPHMFSRFFQNDILHRQTEGSLSDSVPESARGFGLGLSICRRIVEMHRGKIRAFNPTVGGAAFEILLPINRSAIRSDT